MPATVGAPDYMKAVARLEKAGAPEPALAAYERALQRWPGNFTALVGLGNSAYRAGDLEAAEWAFRRAIAVRPSSAAAHNNLAQTLVELGRDDEALVEARVAVGLGGPLEDVSLRTLDAIVSRGARAEQEWNQ
jgi:tetratricopeptide (TPR) repeat protein